MDVETQYCVQVLGETKHGSGPECYDGCVNVTTDVGRKKSQRNNCLLTKMMDVDGRILKFNDIYLSLIRSVLLCLSIVCADLN